MKKDDDEISLGTLLIVFAIGGVIVFALWWHSRVVEPVFYGEVSYEVFSLGSLTQVNYTSSSLFELRWIPGGQSVEESIVRMKTPFSYHGGDVKFYVKTQGRGGVMSLILLEGDGDAWTLYKNDVMKKSFKGYFEAQPDEFSLGHWSTGDGVMDLLNVTEAQIEVFSTAEDVAEKQTLWIGGLE